MNQGKLADKFSGCLLGLAVGDALGAPADGMRPYDVWRTFQRIDGFYGCPRTRSKPGTYTGVTQVALMSASWMSAADAPSGINSHRQSMAAKLQAACSKGSLRASRGVAAAARALHDGTALDKYEGQDGDGEFMPVLVPIGLVAAAQRHDNQWLLSACKSAGGMFSSSKKEILAGAAVAWMIKELVKYEEPVEDDELFAREESLLDRLVSLCEQVERKMGDDGDPLSARLRYVRAQVDAGTPASKMVGVMGNSWRPAEAACFSIFCFLRYEDSDVIKEAATLGGAASLTAGLAGALTGAYSGLGFVPEILRGAVESGSRIILAAEELAGKTCCK